VSGTFYRFIATKTTYAASIPNQVANLGELTRRIRGALRATDYPLLVGELRDFPLSTAQPNFLLCDGSEVAKLGFPELFAYLGDSQGVATDADNFVLPDYVGAATPAATYPAQTTVGGTVSTGGAVTQPTSPGQTGPSIGGNVVSGGRVPSKSFDEIEP
jgi:hypothetical protein